MTEQEQASPSTPNPEGTRCLIDLTVSEDGMQAALSGRVDPGVERQALQVYITSLLRERGLKFGLSSQEMRRAIDQLLAGQEVRGVVIARGVAPGQPQDAQIEVLMGLPEQRTWKQNDSGHVDFRDRGAWPVAEEGRPIAILHPAVPGATGRNVFGMDVVPPMPRLLRLKKGKGVDLQQDGTVAVATVRGLLNRPDEEKFEVLQVLEIKGDVDFNVGHVDFPGVVKVTGGVLPDFRVRAHTLECETLENRSRVEVNGDLKVSGGIMGAEVVAGGKVKARYVRQSKITCGGDCLVDNEIVSSVVSSNGRVVVTSGEGRIVNCQVSGFKGVTTGDLVSSGKSNALVRLGVPPEFEQKIASIKREIESLAREREQLNEMLIGQSTELTAIEEELRGILTALADPTQNAQRENLMTQVQMIRPLRDTLKEGLAQGRQRLNDIIYESQHLGEKVVEMEALLPSGAIWLDVRGTAEVGCEIRTPRASLMLDQNRSSFSAREKEIKDKLTGISSFVVIITNLRASAL